MRFTRFLGWLALVTGLVNGVGGVGFVARPD